MSHVHAIVASEFWKWNTPHGTKFVSNSQLWGNILFISVYVYMMHVCPGQLYRPMKIQWFLQPRVKRKTEMRGGEEKGGGRGTKRVRCNLHMCREDLEVWLLIWRPWTSPSGLLCGPNSCIVFLQPVWTGPSLPSLSEGFSSVSSMLWLSGSVHAISSSRIFVDIPFFPVFPLPFCSCTFMSSSLLCYHMQQFCEGAQVYPCV